MSGSGEDVDSIDDLSIDLIDSLKRPTRGVGDVIGEYEIVRQIGEGGFGTVYEAVHTIIERRAAIKVVSNTAGDAQANASRFVEEARAVNRIHHANVVDIYDLGELEDGSLFLVMELLEGEELADLIRRNGALDPPLICEILGPISSALEAAHAKGIIHRDLKPENIFITRGDGGDMVPKLLDFGVAKLVGESAAAVRHRTRTGIPIGTPQYMSPEQCLALEVDLRSDIYAFGVLCFECLTGRVPFDGDAYLTVANQHTKGPRPRVSALVSSLGDVFDEPVQRMMAVDAAERPATATTAFRLLAAASEAWCAEGEQDTARRIAKTIRSLPSADALLDVQPTQPWIKTSGLPNRPGGSERLRWQPYAVGATLVLAVIIAVLWAM